MFLISLEAVSCLCGRLHFLLSKQELFTRYRDNADESRPSDNKKDSLVKRQGLFNQTEVENYEKNTLECTYFLAIPTIDSYNIIKLLHMCISGSRVDYKEVIACDMGLYQ